MSASFSSIPIEDFARLQNPGTKEAELAVLQDAIFHVGFMYFVNTGLESLISETHAKLPDVFAIPTDDKEKVDMLNSPAFLGYTSLGRETTAKITDLREFPNESIKELVRRYMGSMETLGKAFVGFAAESISLPRDTFDQFLGKMSRLKLVKYPISPAGSQGVGPHKDSISLFTYLAQDNVGGLQVLNKSGEWINAPPIEGSLVINIAQGFEAITGGAPTSRTRYSIPYFQAVRLDLRLDELKESAASIVDRIPITDDKKKRLVDVPSELITPLYESFGEAQLRNRIFSHPDVGEKWYPDEYQRYLKQLLK
ncbi:hypothetical protein N7488_003914 [Penicillium malachiteum]|nr:hypothetical protein N7488_003914 [Penicillium malachiteum]